MEVPKEIQALSQEQMDQHRHHPVMQGIRRYLRDYAEAIKADHTKRWATGTMMSAQDEDRQSVWAQILLELEGLKFEHIAKWYGLALSNPQESEENETVHTKNGDD
jgi:hypothetical protein